eukprot:scaffold252000_cov66-Attheya_sp.AAC.3
MDLSDDHHHVVIQVCNDSNHHVWESIFLQYIKEELMIHHVEYFDKIHKNVPCFKPMLFSGLLLSLLISEAFLGCHQFYIAQVQQIPLDLSDDDC